MSLRAFAGSIMAAVLLAAACAADDVEVAGVSVVEGYRVGQVLDGLNQPTQISAGPAGAFLVAQLNGGENDEAGQILLVDGDNRSVLYESLDKPTGVALIDDDLYVMERDRLSVGSLSGDPLEVVVDELPTNGRSEGTLTVTPDSTLLFNTSGSIREGEVVEDSGIVWELEPGGEPVEFARGFKHAYAHFFGPQGGLWVTEISDGLFDGEPPNDEVVELRRGDDGGWPRCVGDGVPVKEFGGDEASCADAVSSLALFDPGATPTSLVVSPWDEDQMLVALWNEGLVVSLDLRDPQPVTPQNVLVGVEHPQHLLVVDSAVWVVDSVSGRVLELESDG